MKLFFITFLLFLTCRSLGETQRDCSDTLFKGLALENIVSLPPLSNVTSINQIESAEADAKAAYNEVKSNQPSVQEIRKLAPRQENYQDQDHSLHTTTYSEARDSFARLSRERNERFHNLTIPSLNAISKARAPLELALASFVMNNKRVRDLFDRIEYFNSSPKGVLLYMNKNRIAAFQIREGINYTSYQLDENCMVKQIATNLQNSNTTAIKSRINKKVCEDVAFWTKDWTEFPTQQRTIADACLLTGGYPSSFDNCFCPKKNGFINPRMDPCIRSLPENLAKEIILSEGGYIWDAYQLQVQELKKLCDKNADVLDLEYRTKSKILLRSAGRPRLE